MNESHAHRDFGEEALFFGGDFTIAPSVDLDVPEFVAVGHVDAILAQSELRETGNRGIDVPLHQNHALARHLE
jgi:hypothetical protein